MFSFKTLIDSALKIWNDSTPAARVGLVLLAALCVVVIAGVGYWSAQPTYVTLVTEVDAGKMDQIIDGLDKAGIDHKISGAGGHLLVDQSQFAKAKNIANRIGGVPLDGSASGIGGIMRSPRENRKIEVMQKQARLEKSIEKMDVVSEADVHLNVPERGPFDMGGSRPTASVVLTIKDGAQFSYEQAYSIAGIIAFAVEDMDPQSVNISTKGGQTYSIEGDDAQNVNQQVAMRKKEERDLIRKAEHQLFTFLGYGNAAVQVSADFTISTVTSEKITFDAKNKVASREVIDSTKNVSSANTASGAAGTESNLANRNAGGLAGRDSSTESLEADYKVPSSTETRSESKPTRNFMSVSVIVNSAAPSVSSEDGALIAGIEEKVSKLVQNAVGFREGTDSISVEFLAFPEAPEVEPVAAPFDWAFLNDILKNISLAVAALVALVLGFLAMKKFSPAVSGEPQGQPLDDARVEGLREIADLVTENPEVFAQLISVWAGAADADSGNNESQTEAA